MFITVARIQALAPHVAEPVAIALTAALETSMPQFGIDTALECAHFMAQACYETEGFSHFQENLNYTHPSAIAAEWERLTDRAAALCGKPEGLANAAYAWHNGNGSESSGDGWKYRGRGLFQLTGRTEYTAAEDELGHPYIENPDLVALPPDATLTALSYWKRNHCGIHALADDTEAVTRIINGPAREGITRRRDLTEQAKQIFT